MATSNWTNISGVALNPYFNSTTRDVTNPTLSTGSSIADRLGITYDFDEIRKIFEDAAAAGINLNQEIYDNAVKKYQETMAMQSATMLDALRKANAGSLTDGASRGVAAANELSAILGMTQQGADAASELAQQGLLLGSESNAAMQQAIKDALLEHNQLGMQMGQLDTEALNAFIQQYIAELQAMQGQSQLMQNQELAGGGGGYGGYGGYGYGSGDTSNTQTAGGTAGPSITSTTKLPAHMEVVEPSRPDALEILKSKDAGTYEKAYVAMADEDAEIEALQLIGQIKDQIATKGAADPKLLDKWNTAANNMPERAQELLAYTASIDDNLTKGILAVTEDGQVRASTDLTTPAWGLPKNIQGPLDTRSMQTDGVLRNTPFSYDAYRQPAALGNNSTPEVLSTIFGVSPSGSAGGGFASALEGLLGGTGASNTATPTAQRPVQGPALAPKVSTGVSGVMNSGRGTVGSNPALYEGPNSPLAQAAAPRSTGFGGYQQGRTLLDAVMGKQIPIPSATGATSSQQATAAFPSALSGLTSTPSLASIFGQDDNKNKKTGTKVPDTANIAAQLAEINRNPKKFDSALAKTAQTYGPTASKINRASASAAASVFNSGVKSNTGAGSSRSSGSRAASGLNNKGTGFTSSTGFTSNTGSKGTSGGGSGGSSGGAFNSALANAQSNKTGQVQGPSQTPSSSWSSWNSSNSSKNSSAKTAADKIKDAAKKAAQKAGSGGSSSKTGGKTSTGGKTGGGSR